MLPFLTANQIFTVICSCQGSLREARLRVAQLERELDQDGDMHSNLADGGTNAVESNPAEGAGSGTAETASMITAADDDSIQSLPAQSSPSSPRLTPGKREYAQLYYKTAEELRRVKKDNLELNRCVKQIQAEVNEKAPIIQSQRFQYNRMLQSHQQLCTRLSEAGKANADLTSRNKQMEKRSGDMESELASLKLENNDLARQVRCLLKGNDFNEREQEDAAFALPQKMDAQSIIGQTLVEVHSPDEMQQQNQRLLGLARELTKKLEAERAEKARQLAVTNPHICPFTYTVASSPTPSLFLFRLGVCSGPVGQEGGRGPSHGKTGPSQPVD